MRTAQSRKSGRARAASGTSSSTHCGEYTLLVMKRINRATQATCAIRGRLGTVIDSHARPSRPPIVKAPVIQPIPGIVPPEESWMTYHIVPRPVPDQKAERR